MPNIAQLDSLDGLIGAAGIYFEEIRDNPGFDLGTKVLYLRRSITQNTVDFNRSLDLLYNPNLAGDERENNLEFIRSLKTIHNFWINNDVRFGDHGLRSALTHYFSSLGSINPEEFRTAVAGHINNRITELSENHAEEVATQRQVREAAEGQIARQTGWRQELDLPLAQIALPQILNDVLTQEQFEQLSEAMIQVIVANAARIGNLMQNCGLTFAIMQNITIEMVNELFTNYNRVNYLINDGLIPLEDILAMTAEQRAEIFVHFNEVINLLNTEEVTLANILAMTTQQRLEVFENTQAITYLLRSGRVTLAELLSLDAQLRAAMFQNALDVIDLLGSERVTLADLFGLNMQQRAEILPNLNALARLMATGQITLADIVALNTEKRAVVFQDCEVVSQLIFFGFGRITFADIVELTKEQRAEVLSNSQKVATLVTKGMITLTALFALEPAVRRHLFTLPEGAVSEFLAQQSSQASSGSSSIIQNSLFPAGAGAGASEQEKKGPAAPR